MTTDSGDKLLTQEQVIERLGLSMYRAFECYLLENREVRGGSPRQGVRVCDTDGYPHHPDDRWLSSDIEQYRAEANANGRLILTNGESVYLRRRHPMQERLLTAEQVAERLGLSVAAVRQRAFRGKLPPSVRLGVRTVRWRASDIDAMILALTDKR